MQIGTAALYVVLVIVLVALNVTSCMVFLAEGQAPASRYWTGELEPKDALVIDAEVLTGPKLLRQAALDAVRQWRFEPVIRHSVPVMAFAEVREHFFLPEEMFNPRREESMQDDWTASQRTMELERRFPRSPEP